MCLPARGAFLRSSSLLRFLSSRTDECTGNGEPGVMGCTATAGRLRLGPLGLESDALGSSALLARDRDNQLFLGLGRRRVRAETARNLFDRLDSGDGRDFLVDGSCSRRRQLEKACRTLKDLAGGRSYALAHGFRAYILSGIARGASSSSTRRDTLTSSDSIESNSCPCRAGPRSLSHAIGGVCERIVIIFLLPIPRK